MPTTSGPLASNIITSLSMAMALFRPSGGRHQAVLVLDGNGVVIAHHPQGAHRCPSRSDGRGRSPRSGRSSCDADFVGIGLGVQHAVDAGVDLVDLGVLGVEEVDGVAQVANGRHGIDALPEQVGGIEIGADDSAARPCAAAAWFRDCTRRSRDAFQSAILARREPRQMRMPSSSRESALRSTDIPESG